MIGEIVAYTLAGLMIGASIYLPIRHELKKKQKESYMTFKAIRKSACLLKDHTGLFGYSAPYKSDTETNSGGVQTSDERFYVKTQHGKKTNIHWAYNGQLVSESQLEDLELTDASAITPVYVTWESR